jgi:hypothetical protein
MHGLIFETSIWLLAGSTRLIHHRSHLKEVVVSSRQQQQTLKQNCSSCRKSNDLTGYKSRQSRQEMFQDTHTHAIEDRHTVEILRTELDRNQARAGGEIDLEWDINSSRAISKSQKAFNSRFQLKVCRIPSIEEIRQIPIENCANVVEQSPTTYSMGGQ